MKEAAKGVPRDVFLKAMWAEGAPLGGGYRVWYLEPLFQDQFFYGRQTTNKKYKPGDLPRTEELAEKAIILPATQFVTPSRELLDQFAEAFHKVAENLKKLKSIK